jgi:hypothetical protein
MKTHTETETVKRAYRTYKASPQTRKTKFLECVDSITAARNRMQSAQSLYRIELKRAQDEGFSLTPLKRAIQDQKLDNATRSANEKEEILYRRWLEEL